MVQAQVMASGATVDFINTVGFDEDNHARMVDFKYTTVNSTGGLEGRTLSVPLLVLMPIPNLEVRVRVLAWECVPACCCASVHV